MDLKTKGRGKAHKHISQEVYQFWTKEQPIHVSQLDCVIVIQQEASNSTSSKHLCSNTTNTTYTQWSIS
jgi:hypothetical protein